MLLSTFVFAAGCSGGGSYAPASTNPTSNNATSGGVVTQSAGVLSLPSFNGFSGAITTPAASSGAGAQATIVLQTATPAGLPSLSNALVFASLTLSNSVTFNGTPGFTLNVPAVPSGTYYIAFYDPAKSSQGWQLAALGPATSNGATLSFAQTSIVTTLNGGVTYWFGLYRG